MRREQRLKRRQDFSAVYRSGKAYGAGPLVLRVKRNLETAAPRYGFAISRKVGNAVQRNRIKRRLRALARQSGVGGQVDIVIIARPRAAEATHAELERTLRRLLARAGLREGARGR